MQVNDVLKIEAGNQFKALALGNFAGGGSIGSAAATVDIATIVNIAQTTAAQTLTIPSPTAATPGRLLFINNTGSASFLVGAATVAAGGVYAASWTGSAWAPISSSGGGSSTNVAAPSIFTPSDAIFPATAPAGGTSRNGHPTIAYDAATQEDVDYVSSVPIGYTGTNLAVHIDWVAATATTGDVVWAALFERLTPGGSDLDADDFAAAVQATATTTSATSGVVTRTTITVTQAQADSIAAVDAYRLRVRRVAANAGDTMVGDAQVVGVLVDFGTPSALSAAPMIWDPNQALFPAASPAQASSRNGHPLLAFDATVAENIDLIGSMPVGYVGGSILFNIDWVAATATTGAVVWSAAFERLGAGLQDIDADGFATAVQAAATTANATSGVVARTVITLTQAQADAVVALDAVRIRVSRVAADGGDTMVGDAQVVAMTATF
jgi:hypothetical protein